MKLIPKYRWRMCDGMIALTNDWMAGQITPPAKPMTTNAPAAASSVVAKASQTSATIEAMVEAMMTRLAPSRSMT